MNLTKRLKTVFDETNFSLTIPEQVKHVYFVLLPEDRELYKQSLSLGDSKVQAQAQVQAASIQFSLEKLFHAVDENNNIIADGHPRVGSLKKLLKERNIEYKVLEFDNNHIRQYYFTLYGEKKWMSLKDRVQKNLPIDEQDIVYVRKSKRKRIRKSKRPKFTIAARYVPFLDKNDKFEDDDSVYEETEEYEKEEVEEEEMMKRLKAESDDDQDESDSDESSCSRQSESSEAEWSDTSIEKEIEREG